MKIPLLILALVASSFAQAQITRFDAEELRAQLVEFNLNPPASEVVFLGETDDMKKRRFAKYFADKVFPKLNEMSRDIVRYRSLHILTDAYLHGSEQEREGWAGPGGEFEKIMAKVNDWTVNTEWTEIVSTWGKLAEGLSGELPEMARRLARERELERFELEHKPMLDEADKLHKDFRLAVNQVPAAADLREYGRLSTEVRVKFKNGEITFQQAREQIKALVKSKGYNVVGYQAVQKAGENLNKMAILRAKLAKTKPGIRTWAEYQIELSGQSYTPEYRGTKNQREFLQRYIAALRPLREAFIEERIQALGLESERESLKYQHTSLLTLPGRQLLQKYFPADRVVSIWEETLLESGFDAAGLRQITVDISPREGKNATSAYLSSFMEPYTGETVVDIDKLEVVHEPKGSKNLKPGFAYILQNFKDQGVDDLRVLFHEGGHATDHLMRGQFDIFSSQPYGYTEVASMTTERFVHDPLVLWHKAVPAGGKKPTLEEIRKLVENDEKNEIMNLVAMATTALFDLELWDYDYSAPGAMTFMDRVKFLDEEVRKLAGDLPYEETDVPLYYWNVAIPHFVSGSVRNIGYTYAEIASRMMAGYFTDEIEKLSGRRTWWRQPLLGPMIAERFYARGWRDQFPTSIEKITGRKFSAEEVIKEMAEQLKSKGCERKLLPETGA